MKVKLLYSFRWNPNGYGNKILSLKKDAEMEVSEEQGKKWIASKHACSADLTKAQQKAKDDAEKKAKDEAEKAKADAQADKDKAEAEALAKKALKEENEKKAKAGSKK